MTQFIIHFPERVHKKLKIVSAARGKTMNDVIVNAVTKDVEDK